MTKIEVIRAGVYTGHRDCVYSVVSGWREEEFYSCGGDGMIVRWVLTKPDEGELVAKVSNSVYAIRSSFRENELLIGHNYEGVHLIDTSSKKEICSAKITSSAIFDIAIIDEQAWIATGSGELIILSAKDLTVIFKIKLSQNSLRCICSMSESDHVAIGCSDHKIYILSKKKFRLLYTLAGHTNSVFSVIYSPDKKWLLSGSRDAQIKIWNCTDNYAMHMNIPAHMFAINHIEYSPDRNHFASASMDKTIKIWDAHTFRLLKVIDKARHGGHLTSVNKLYWSCYENKLISCSDDKSVMVWDIKFNSLAI
ncbi:MAG: WD40 repeat domain-containing protein [Cytophagaceae bacterium]|nr:WD40 repeat domain-containing protein [Cytophagaceae bacterium]MDW8455487.1 WD40 repeat domain-containing protein [Cytophagaceae bacterium]